MNLRAKTVLWLLVTAVCLAAVSTLSASAGQEPAARPIVITGEKHDLSPPLSHMIPAATQAGNREALPVRRKPDAISRVSPEPDPVVQQAVTARAPATNVLNFKGQSALGVAPPDTNGSVGETQYVQTVNTSMAVYDKNTSALLFGPVLLNTLWTGFGGLCETTNGGDPIVLYDKLAGRWMISQLAYNSTFSSNFVCIAVSTSSDATGTYNRYAFNFGNRLPDYLKFGVWPDAYYFSADIFRSGLSFNGARACAFDRTAMLAGTTAIGICFQRGTSDFSMLPSDMDGIGAAEPPVASPNYYLELDTASNTQLKLFQFHVDFASPANSTFVGPSLILIAAWTELCPTTRACIPQPSPGERLDAIGDRLMYRLAYRNFGTHESLVANHTVNRGGGVAGVRWYEIRSPGAAPIVYQQGTFAPAPNLWMASVGTDKNGSIFVGFSASTASLKPSIAYTGRLAGDALGTLRSPSLVIVGTGVQTSTVNRWGDYSSMSVDPLDDCTMWYTQEYYEITGSFNWTTRIVKFKPTGCP